MNYIVTVDVGTSSMRSIVYDTGGRMHFTVSSEYYSIFKPPGLVEQNPHDWRDALVKNLKEVAEFTNSNGIEPEAIAVTSQRASVFPVDAEGNVLYNALMWQDKRTTGISAELTRKISMDSIYKKTGLRANPYFSLPKMLWFKTECPDIYSKAYRLVGVQDYIIYLLTGSFKTDWSQAARTMLMNINTFDWDKELLEVAGIDSNLLCELCQPGSAAGGLSASLASVVGMKTGIPVIMSGGDQQNAAVALNILKPGIAEANTGTGSFVIAYSDKPVFDERCRVLCSAAAIPGKWIVEAGIFNTGAIYRWFREQFYTGESAKYKVMDEEAAASPTGANGVMLIPHFEGSAAPFWNPYAKGLFFNLSLGTKRGDLARAILEGIAMEIADDISLIEAIAGRIDTISVAGGMTNAELFNTIQANAFNRKVIRYTNSEASSLGAAISASVTLGYFSSYEEAFRTMSEEVERTYQPDVSEYARYEQLRVQKHELYDALNSNGVYEKFMKPV